jgi:integrase
MKTIIEVKRGNTVVKIYRHKGRRYKNKHYELFTVAYRLNGKQHRKNFSQYQDAERFASDTATALERGRAQVLSLNVADWQSYLAAKNLLQPFGIPLHAAIEEYVAFRKRKKLIEKRVGEIVDELLAAKQSAELSDRYIETLRTYLRRFADSFQTNIGSINTGAIVRWLDSLKIAPRSWNNVRQAVVTLFNFARRRGYLPKGETTEAADVETKRDRDGEIAILTPAELSKLLRKSKPVYQLYFAFAAFTGIRSAELLGLDWSEINFETILDQKQPSEKGYVEVKARKAKTATRRLVPMQPNLAKWLAPYHGRKGKLFQSRRTVDAAIKFAKRMGIPWKANCLRHSYATYRLSIVPDAGRIALEMGNSAAKLFTNYRDLDRENHAPEWFAIEPPPRRSRRIIPFVA